ncbi:MAG: hypothetical protein FJZ67_11985 [Bacteroidetes bacterium]|nr:hypothetical protein [Bacteroidota bacterium]
MNTLLKEFNQRLGSVKIYENKVEITYKSGLFGFGEKITEIIEFDNIKNFKILGLEELGIGINSNPLNIKVIRIFAIDQNKILKSKANNQNSQKDFLDIDMGLKNDTAQDIYDFIKKILIEILEKNEKERIEKEKVKMEKERIREINRINNLSNNISSTLNELDQNNDGEVDLIDNDFNQLLNKNQKTIIAFDKNYIHQFVKVSNFIKTKKQNTQKIFESIRDTSTQEELEERVHLLKNQIHAYELLLFHSINMIGSMVSEDLITFYEIYESFDKLGMFNSNWENEVSEKLTNIGDKLDDLMYSIYNMEQNIVSELSHLSYVTQESFEDLNRSVTSQLKEVQSSINTNNLLTGIQAYQLYKINKNTKGLRN